MNAALAKQPRPRKRNNNKHTEMKQKLPQQKDETNKDGNQEPQRAIKISRKNKRNRETEENTETRKTNKERKKEQGKRQKHLQYETNRRTLISMEDGLRTLNIASLNPDTMKEIEMQQGIINELTKNKIHIAMIQETHITKDLNYMMGNYRIITSAAERNNETGVVTGGNCNTDT